MSSPANKIERHSLEFPVAQKRVDSRYFNLLNLNCFFNYLKFKVSNISYKKVYLFRIRGFC